MPFVSHALTLHQFEGRPLEVYDIFQNVGWRLMLAIRACVQLYWALFKLIYFVYWLQFKVTAIIISCFGVGRRDLAGTFDLRKYVLLCFLASIRSFEKPAWRFFWNMYYLFAKDKRDFIMDYTTAWSIQPGCNMEIIVFLDNGRRFSVPCSSRVDDQHLLTKIRMFYDLQRTRRGLFELISVKSVQRIDVVKLHNNDTVGRRLKDPLDLGHYGPYGRLSLYFENPFRSEGIAIIERLVNEEVLAPPGRQQHALNIISSWDPQVTRTVILFPIVLSLIISIVWSVVASTKFKADVQLSTQTGFTIGSYVVTAGISPRHSSGPLEEWLILAGALLVALVAFLDGKVNGMEH